MGRAAARGGDLRLPDPLAAKLRDLAAEEPSPVVRAQLASTAARLPAELGLDLAAALATKHDDRDDPHIPLLTWWAVERHAAADPAGVLARFATTAAWEAPLASGVVLPRLVRRYAAERTPAGDDACRRLIVSAPSDEGRRSLLVALEDATRGRAAGGKAADAELMALAAAESAAHPDDAILTRLAARLGDRDALARARAVAADPDAPLAGRAPLIELLGERAEPADLPMLLGLANGPAADAALGALGRFDDPSIAPALIDAYPKQPAAWRARVRDLLIGRVSGAKALLDAIGRGTIDLKDVPLDQVARMATLGDTEIDAAVKTLWGTVAGPTPEEKLAEVRRLNNDLRASTGDPDRGKALFTQHCGACHRLFDEGNVVGPELTHANRTDRDFLLVSLVDPGRVVRKEYQSTVVHTRDGRVLTGLIAEQTPERLTLVGPDAARTTVPTADVEETADSPASLMPENLYRQFDPQQLRDLFSYLQRK